MDLRPFPKVLSWWLIGFAVLASPALDFTPDLLAQTGSVQGQVRLSPRIAARRSRFRLYNEYGPGAAQQPAARTNEMANVVIYLDSAGLVGSDPGDRPEMKQINEAFSPHVLPVGVGSQVQFPNADPFFHNVFSLSRAKTFDLGRFPEGSSKGVLFDRPGVVQVFCHIHSDMSAVVLVTPSAFFGTPDSTGAYTISGIPVGTYRVVAWHERAKTIVSTVRIEEGKPARVDFNIPIIDVESDRH